MSHSIATEAAPARLASPAGSTCRAWVISSVRTPGMRSLTRTQGRMIERDHQHLVHRTCAAPSTAASRSISRSGALALLDLDKQAHAGERAAVASASARVGTRRARKARVEPRAGVEPAQGREVVVRDAAPAVGGAVEDLVMQQHDLVVPRQHDVDLAHRGAALGRRQQRRQACSPARRHCGRDGRRHGCGRLRRRAGDRATALLRQAPR